MEFVKIIKIRIKILKNNKIKKNRTRINLRLELASLVKLSLKNSKYKIFSWFKNIRQNKGKILLIFYKVINEKKIKILIKLWIIKWKINF